VKNWIGEKKRKKKETNPEKQCKTTLNNHPPVRDQVSKRKNIEEVIRKASTFYTNALFRYREDIERNFVQTSGLKAKIDAGRWCFLEFHNLSKKKKQQPQLPIQVCSMGSCPQGRKGVEDQGDGSHTKGTPGRSRNSKVTLSSLDCFKMEVKMEEKKEKKKKKRKKKKYISLFQKRRTQIPIWSYPPDVGVDASRSNWCSQDGQDPTSYWRKWNL